MIQSFGFPTLGQTNILALAIMREIVYIQTGNSANYVGAHFWNTQECYLTDEGTSVYDRRVSFRESLADSSPGEVRHLAHVVHPILRPYTCSGLDLLQPKGSHL